MIVLKEVGLNFEESFQTVCLICVYVFRVYVCEYEVAYVSMCTVFMCVSMRGLCVYVFSVYVCEYEGLMSIFC